MSTVKQVILVYEDGEVLCVPVEAFPGMVTNQTPVVPPKRSKKRAKPRRRCQTCDTLVDRDVWEEHTAEHRVPNTTEPVHVDGAEPEEGGMPF